MEHQGEMIHKALAIGLDDDLFSGIQALLNNFRLQHQKQILEKYARDNGIGHYKFYVDDGYSGTNFAEVR